MNTTTPVKWVDAICRKSYRGVWLYETGEGVVILSGDRWYLFQSFEAAQAFIDASLDKVVTN